MCPTLGRFRQSLDLWFLETSSKNFIENTKKIPNLVLSYTKIKLKIELDSLFLYLHFMRILMYTLINIDLENNSNQEVQDELPLHQVHTKTGYSINQ